MNFMARDYVGGDVVYADALTQTTYLLHIYGDF